MVIMEAEIRMERGCFKDAVRLDILCVEQDNEEGGGASDDKMVEGSRGLFERTATLPLESSVTTISEPEASSHKNSVMVMAKEDVHLIAHINGIVHIEENKKGLEESDYPSADEGVEGLMDEIQGTTLPPIGSSLKEEVWPTEDNNPDNSEKALEIDECRSEAGAQEFGTSPSEEVEEREDETISVQYHELETRQHIEADKEREIEYPKTLPLVKKSVSEIHEESHARIKEEEEEQIAKLSFDVVEKGVKTVAKNINHDTMTELIDVDKKNQRQVEGHEKNVSSEGKQQRISTQKVNGTQYMFMGYPKGHLFLVTTIATAFAVLAFIYMKDFTTRTTILENFILG